MGAPGLALFETWVTVILLSAQVWRIARPGAPGRPADSCACISSVPPLRGFGLVSPPAAGLRPRLKQMPPLGLTADPSTPLPTPPSAKPALVGAPAAPLGMTTWNGQPTTDNRQLLYVCNTPTLNFGTSGFSEAASSAVTIAARVSAGSMIRSIHRRAAPYRGSICSS